MRGRVLRLWQVFGTATTPSAREAPAVIGTGSTEDALLHVLFMTASLVGHLCAVLNTGQPVNPDEEFYSAWADLGIFSGGLAAAPVAVEGVPALSADAVAAAAAGAGGALDGDDGAAFVARCIEFADEATLGPDQDPYSLTPEGKRIATAVIAKAYRTAKLASGGNATFEGGFVIASLLHTGAWRDVPQLLGSPSVCSDRIAYIAARVHSCCWDG